MSFPEMIYRTITFLFSDLWVYVGLILLIITIRGDITIAMKATGDFFKRVSARLQQKKIEDANREKLRQKATQYKP